MTEATSLESLRVGIPARIGQIDWNALDPACAGRLRDFGFDEGVTVESLHQGPFGRDPMAVRVGRMIVAIRRSHARAIRVIPAA
ncbi:ferrous iron transport protein A [Sphingomonas sp. HDW15A]|uniref:FeoA family protein n=1 Tax=Sphingomonas sp. HDW15A TaxID=2714942 RepID=UPI001407CB75|nr:FeoA family protein [Sphingomonas sp. HDW15A]QIK97008.1 ferrous iron transport protein A [Sphingomonas sp. HDW15A]